MNLRFMLFATLMLAACGPMPRMSQQEADSYSAILEQNRNSNNAALQQQMNLINNRRATQPQYQAPAAPQGPTAYWTGNSQIGQSVTGASGFNCEYNYAGRTFWRMYTGGCPSSIQIQ